MNKKLLVVAVATAFAIPMAAQAELKLSGTVQAEIGSVDIGNSDDRITTSADNGGTISPGGGPNKIRLDFDEKLGAGLDAFGRVDWAFDTSHGSGFKDREAFVGLKGSNAHFKMGRVQGIYKSVRVIDPFYSTGAQGRRAGGMTGSAYGHNGFMDNIIEIGFKGGGFSATLQGVADEPSEKDGDLLIGLDYDAGNWGIFAAGAYQDFELDKVDTNPIDDDDDEDNNRGNAKVGGWFKTGGLKLGLQYEMGEIGTLQQEGLGSRELRPGDTGEGDYVFGSAAYTMGNITLGAWVGGYMSDDDDEDAMSYSLGAAYSFSKRTMAYAAYHDTNSDNDARDWDAFAAGVRHSF